MKELVPKTIELARQAKRYDLNFTIDAEEADRLELSLDVIAAVASDKSLANWDGFGLAVQAYQKRGRQVIDWLVGLADHLDRASWCGCQGCLLGQRGEARAGARACRFPGLHPQGDDGSALHRLRGPHAGGAPPALSAIRDP